MSQRKRRKPELDPQVQEIINHLRPEVFERYANVSDTVLESFIRGWVGWALRKIHPRPNGEPYNSASPHVIEQIRLWASLGRPYEFNGGTDWSEEEHNRVEGKKSRRAKQQTDTSLLKTRRRRRRTA